jgi:hypothetical protein
MYDELNIVRMFEYGPNVRIRGYPTRYGYGDVFRNFWRGPLVKAGQTPHAKNDFSTSPYHSKNLWYTY